ncbi:MAG: PEP-CTERM sorting domain-containing protein [Chromatiaceae bacterium]|nr:PEP-CTERM sorting domain-containing protein [Chromatiaceae bacterium]
MSRSSVRRATFRGGLPFELNANSTSILFENPFPLGSLLVIERLLEWQDVRGTAPQAWQGGVIEVTEYPAVPIPATWLLVALGLAGVRFRRRN